MIKVGLSGNRFSGKNTSSKIFQQIGVPVFDADVVLKFILNHNFEINTKIRNTFGDVFTLKGNLLDLSKFSEKRKFNDLIDIVEYELLNAYQVFNSKNKEKVYTIFHSSILFEREWNKSMDFNISVFSNKEERKERFLQKFKNDKSIFNKIILDEMDDIYKNSMSDFIINNYLAAYNIYGELSDQINKIDQKIIDKYLLYKHSDYDNDVNLKLV